MKTFTIIKSPCGNNLYSIVLGSTEIIDGKEVKDDLIQSGKTLEQVDETERLFRLYGKTLKEK